MDTHRPLAYLDDLAKKMEKGEEVVINCMEKLREVICLANKLDSLAAEVLPYDNTFDAMVKLDSKIRNDALQVMIDLLNYIYDMQINISDIVKTEDS